MFIIWIIIIIIQVNVTTIVLTGGLAVDNQHLSLVTEYSHLGVGEEVTIFLPEKSFSDADFGNNF